MKKLLFGAAIMVCGFTVSAQKKADDVAKFDSETIDMGNLKQNNPQKAVFKVTNIGTQPLIIETANPTCGCTIGDYTQSPIMPGKQGEISATYNAVAGGNFEKHMTVKFAGVDEVKSITIKGTVLSAEDYAKAEAAKPAPVETKTKANGVKTKTTHTKDGAKTKVKTKSVAAKS